MGWVEESGNRGKDFPWLARAVVTSVVLVMGGLPGGCISNMR